MNKNNLALAIIGLCIISLIIGLIKPTEQQPQNNNISTENSLFTNVDTLGDKIALLNIDGVISADINSNYFSEAFNLDNFLNAIDRVQKDTRVKAVLIRINSPGGTVAASQDVYDAILRLRQEKPVVVSMSDVAASGGYYIASAADRIVAQKGTMTGSIGVILNFTNISELTQKLGIDATPIKSGKYKDSGSMYRKMSSDEEILFQTSVNNAYKQFVGAIKTARVDRKDNYDAEIKKLQENTLKKYADGRVFLGEEAYELGFVDAIGSKYDAQKLASKMAGYENTLPLVSYNRPSGLMNILMGMENILKIPSLKNVVPFSVKHSRQPLMIME